MSRIKKWITRQLIGDLRGTNPNSLANLTRAQPIAIAEPSPPPAPPTPPARREAAPDLPTDPAGFFAQMRQYEEWKTQIYLSEQAKYRNIKQEVLQEVQAQIGDDDDDGGGDPLLEKALEAALPILLAKFAGSGQAAPLQMPQDQQTPAPVAVVSSEPEIVPPESFSVDHARDIIASLEKTRPKILKQVKTGEISKEEVFAYLQLQGIPPENAEILYAEVMK